ncbi:S1 family peptidase [Streptomyces sp. NPDC058674]|uniref:S1 family peptidase n=1 Tax=Streptomyces sp. NPDC058674 TaxID=3346592 RepID=UPI00366332E1
MSRSSRRSAPSHRSAARRPLWRPLVGVVAVGAATAVCAAVVGGSANAVVGGQDSTDRYPFMVSIPLAVEKPDGSTLTAVCGGTLIDPEWVVTAGHCALDGKTAHPTGTVRVGSDRRSSGGTVRTIVEKVRHPRYDGGGDKRAFDDIALLRLDRPVTRQAPIRIADHAPRIGAATRILGFGTTAEAGGPEDWKFAERLQQLDTRRAPADRCLDINTAGELCTTSRVPGAMACNGDSGGPQIQRIGGRWQLVGATSGDGDHEVNGNCGGGPGIWTSVPAYKQWITETLAARR